MAGFRSVPTSRRAPGVRAALILCALFGSGAPASLLAADGKAAAAAKLTAAEIVDRHIAARGGLKAWRGLQTLSLSGTMEAGTGDSVDRSLKVATSRRAPLHEVEARAAAARGKAEPEKQLLLPFRMEAKRPDKSRVEIEFAGKTAVQVYDGTHGWKLRPFLNRSDVEPFTPEELQSESEKGALDGPLVDYAAKGTKVELEKVEPVEGHDAYRLKLTLQGGRVQHIWIDTHSFLDVKVEGIPRRMDGRMHDVWVYQRDFRSVDGLMIPFVLETAVEGYPGTHRMLLEKAAVNPKLDDSRFARPDGGAGG
jgi:hypothetical protein